MAGLGLALLAWAGSPDKPQGGVVLNRDPPQAPASGLKWELGEVPQRPSTTAAQEAPGAGDPAAAAADAEAGIWATPATFSLEG